MPVPPGRVLVLDGAMFTLRAQHGLSAAEAHAAYLRAGADIIRSDTFGAVTAAATAAAAAVARGVADAWTAATPGQPRYVAGVLSAATPGGDLRALFGAQLRGLIAGGVDLLLAETLASLDQVRAALDAVRAVPAAPPLMVSVAVTAAGVLLSGETIDALCAALAPAPPFSVGLNCGDGTGRLRPPLARLARLAPCRVSCHPSAGTPDAFGEFDDSPDDTARFLLDAARAGLIDVAGGCCGTTPEHIAAVAAAVRGLPARMAGFRE